MEELTISISFCIPSLEKKEHTEHSSYKFEPDQSSSDLRRDP
jgi:hypothetical protein